MKYAIKCSPENFVNIVNFYRGLEYSITCEWIVGSFIIVDIEDKNIIICRTDSLIKQMKLEIFEM